MALKTFNIDKKAYDMYSKHCKTQGISMSKRIEKFIKEEIEKIYIKEEHNSSTNNEPQNLKISKDNKYLSETLQDLDETEHSFKKYC